MGNGAAAGRLGSTSIAAETEWAATRGAARASLDRADDGHLGPHRRGQRLRLPGRLSRERGCPRRPVTSSIGISEPAATPRTSGAAGGRRGDRREDDPARRGDGGRLRANGRPLAPYVPSKDNAKCPWRVTDTLSYHILCTSSRTEIAAMTGDKPGVAFARFQEARVPSSGRPDARAEYVWGGVSRNHPGRAGKQVVGTSATLGGDRRAPETFRPQPRGRGRARRRGGASSARTSRGPRCEPCCAGPRGREGLIAEPAGVRR
jgi:hypothetical protein